MPGLRTLGVRGKNLPTIRAQSVKAADFAIGGIIGRFSRQFAKAFPVNSPTDVATIFRKQAVSGYYGWDAINGFFANLAGVQATLYVLSHPGYTGSAIDAVTAAAQVNDTNGVAQQILTIEDAYQGEPAYGADGNNTGYQIEVGNRFATTVKTAGTSADTFVILNSVADIKVGDMIECLITGGAAKTVYEVVTAVDPSTGKVSFSGTIDATSNAAQNDVVSVPGFRIHTYRKDPVSGIVSEVDTTYGKLWCTIYSAVPDYYVSNVFASSPNISVTVNTTTSALGSNFPAAVAATAFLASGADGTAPSGATSWAPDTAYFNALPIRFIMNPETTDAATQKALEAYCKGRTDTPKAIFNVAENQTKAQLITIGNGFQRGDDVLGYIWAQWLGVTDPFNNAPNPPDRAVPNVGHMMGLFIRCISTKGIHYAPGTTDMPLYGVNSVIGTQFTDDQDRTDIANAGVNCIEDRSGSGFGIMPRNAFTPSTDPVFQFGNSIMMRDYLKVSAVTSLQSSENTPSTIGRAKADGTAIYMFMLTLWKQGSTGTVPLGETFAQGEDAQGNPDDISLHVKVQADEINNPASSLAAGNRNVYAWFTFPAPAGSIEIGVGIMIPS